MSLMLVVPNLGQRFIQKLVKGWTLHNLSYIKIHDVFGSTKEGLHTTKINKIHLMVIKLDLAKDFDKVNSMYLRINLIRVGVNIQVLN